MSERERACMCVRVSQGIWVFWRKGDSMCVYAMSACEHFSVCVSVVPAMCD